MSENKRIDLHTHSFFSDGALLPSEILRRAAVMGHRALAITDHADASNLAVLIDALKRVIREQPGDFETQLLIGVELTHVGPASIDKLARRAKALGAEIVVVHGETIVEPGIGRRRHPRPPRLSHVRGGVHHRRARRIRRDHGAQGPRADQWPRGAHLPRGGGKDGARYRCPRPIRPDHPRVRAPARPCPGTAPGLWLGMIIKAF